MYGQRILHHSAYLRDLFGTYQVGAIYGRLLTASSVAAILGPVLVNYLRRYQIDHGVPRAQAYSFTMYVMCGLLLIGFLCNFAMPCLVNEEVLLPREHSGMNVRLAVLWVLVGIPLLWGSP